MYVVFENTKFVCKSKAHGHDDSQGAVSLPEDIPTKTNLGS